MAPDAGMGSYPLVAFVAATDGDRAKDFYGNRLGLRLTLENLPFALFYDAHGVSLHVQLVREMKPAPYTVLGWDVQDIARTIEDLAAVGITPERFAGLEQDELGVWTSPTSKAKVAWFKDPDGNVLSIAEFPR
ncbi:MAG TPA: VOC family protein [Candidatus Binataceae bacterium]|nr:VOC family protein [Candidatus Binataceae bacterium]